jgi:hypothetical protein
MYQFHKFVMKLYMFRTVRLSIIRSLFTVHSAMVYVIQALYTQLSSRTRPSCSCSKAFYKPVWHIPLLSVQWINCWWWTEELSETCIVSWQICKSGASSWFYYKEINSGVAGFYTPGGGGWNNNNGRPWHKLRNSITFIEFHFICLNNLKSVERRIFFIQNTNFAASWTPLPRGRPLRPCRWIKISVDLLTAHTVILLIRDVPFIMYPSIATIIA